MEGERIGIIKVKYDYHGVNQNLTEIKLDYQEYINSVLQIHTTENIA